MSLPPELAQVDEELARIKDEKSKAASAQEFEEAARLRDREKELSSKRDELEASWRENTDKAVTVVTDKDVADVVSDINAAFIRHKQSVQVLYQCRFSRTGMSYYPDKLPPVYGK